MFHTCAVDILIFLIKVYLIVFVVICLFHSGSILGGNVAALKYFMPLVGLDLGPPREPMKAMNENEARQFKKDVEDLGFFTWDPATIV